MSDELQHDESGEFQNDGHCELLLFGPESLLEEVAVTAEGGESSLPPAREWGVECEVEWTRGGLHLSATTRRAGVEEFLRVFQERGGRVVGEVGDYCDAVYRLHGTREELEEHFCVRFDLDTLLWHTGSSTGRVYPVFLLDSVGLGLREEDEEPDGEEFPVAFLEGAGYEWA